jgi:hypothetical protein
MDTIFLKAGCGFVDTFLLNNVLTMPKFLSELDGDFINMSLSKNKRLTPAQMYQTLRGNKKEKEAAN